MNFDQSYIVAAFIAMGSAIVALALAIAYLWKQQNKHNEVTEKRFQKLDEELKQAIRGRCIRGGGDPRPCLNQTCVHSEPASDSDLPPTTTRRRFMDPGTSGDGSVGIRKVHK
jgi:hypothetical protein